MVAYAGGLGSGGSAYVYVPITTTRGLVTLAFRRRIQILLLTYFLTYLLVRGRGGTDMT